MALRLSSRHVFMLQPLEILNILKFSKQIFLKRKPSQKN